MALLTKPDVFVFDIDGVLVDVTDSYREAIRVTVDHFTGETVTNELIQEYKNSGGWNNDWLLSERLINERLGARGEGAVLVTYPQVVEYFNKIFLGENGNGLIRKERWLPDPGLLQGFAQHAALSVFTGRTREEADITMRRFVPDIVFDPFVTDDTVANPKPAPDGLQMIIEKHPGKSLLYIGDTVDDARSARDAGVGFVGVAAVHSPRREELAARLREIGAVSVISQINELKQLVEGVGA